MADRRAKQMSRSPMYCIYRLLFVFDSLTWCSFSAVCKISDVHISNKAAAPTVSIYFQPNLIESMEIRGL